MGQYVLQVLLLAVYAALLFVQSFYTPNNNYQSLTRTHAVSGAASHDASKIFPNKKGDSRHGISRLNKRFQPQAVLSYVCCVAPSPVSYSVVNGGTHPKDYFLISSILTDSLRGPPAIG